VAPLLSDVMRGNGLGCVVESSHPHSPAGTLVMGFPGWRRYLCQRRARCRSAFTGWCGADGGLGKC
jgi:NADPH-dependent curcumin reductase CurA